MGSMDLPNPMHTTSFEGVAQEHLGLVLYEMINNDDIDLFLLPLVLFYKSPAGRQQWWPNQHPLSMAGAQTIQID
jgi:hypothetical protein